MNQVGYIDILYDAYFVNAVRTTTTTANTRLHEKSVMK